MANKYIHETVSKFARGVKQLLLVGGLVVLVSCSSSSSDTNLTAAELRTKEIAVLDETRVGLMESLAKLYPNGKLPTDQQIAASKLLMQNPSVFRSSPAGGNIKAQAFAGVTADFSPVYRIQNTTLYGSYFFTIYDSEKASALSLNPDWKLEGPAFYASPTPATDLSPVYRFRNKFNGSYVFSIYEAERNSINTSYADTFAEEGVAWYARQTPAEGFTELYRFRNKTNGTYLFTAYASEKQSIIDNYPEIFVFEGVAYYVQVTAAGAAYTGTVIDGYIRGATIFWDCNDNLKLDLDEIKTISGVGGRYLIGDMPNVACVLRASVPANAIDEDTNKVIGVPMVLSSIPGKPQLISPLTTPVGIGAMTEVDVLALLNGSTLSLTDDYIAAGSAGLQNHNAARYVAATLKAISGQISTDNKEVRANLLSNALSQLPQSAWTTKTPLTQATFENYFTDNWGLGLIDPFAPFLTKQSFMLDQDAILALPLSQRVAAESAVRKALDAINSRPDMVAGGVVIWGALPQSVRSTFAPTLADTSIFPETTEVAQLRAVLFVELAKAQVKIKAAENESRYVQRAQLLKSATDASLTSLSTAATVVAPATRKIIKKAKITQVPNLLKTKIAALKNFRKYITVVNDHANCASFFTRLPNLLDSMEGNVSFLVEDMIPWGLEGVTCINTLAGSEKMGAALEKASGYSSIAAGTLSFADAKEYIQLLSAADDIVLAILDLASLDVPRAILAEMDLIIVKRVTMAIDQHEAADAADAAMQIVFDNVSAEFNLFADEMRDKLLSARLMPYIRPIATACDVGYFLSSGRCLENPLVTNITPATATLNTATVFTVTGTNLPLTAVLVVVSDHTCLSPVNNSSNGFSQTCTPMATGIKAITIKTAPSGTVIDNTRTVNVTAAPIGGNINLPSTSYLRGTNVALSTEATNGADTLMNAPPYTLAANAAEWDFNAPTTGKYELFATYASNLNRAVAISFNGTVTFASAMVAVTGGWLPANRQTLSQGIVQLTAGANTMRVARGDVFPHIKGFTLVPVITGSFSVPANLENGTPFTVPAGVSSCTITASGTWNGGASYLQTDANGIGPTQNTPWANLQWAMGSASALSLVATGSNSTVAIGSSSILAVLPNTVYQFRMNDTIGTGGYSDNYGVLSVAYSCN